MRWFAALLLTWSFQTSDQRGNGLRIVLVRCPMRQRKGRAVKGGREHIGHGGDRHFDKIARINTGLKTGFQLFSSGLPVDPGHDLVAQNGRPFGQQKPGATGCGDGFEIGRSPPGKTVQRCLGPLGVCKDAVGDGFCLFLDN